MRKELVAGMLWQRSLTCWKSNRSQRWKNPRKCNSESRLLFERDEESAFSAVFCEKQIPRFARDDNYSPLFRNLLEIRKKGA
jgi:hypothetical protein